MSTVTFPLGRKWPHVVPKAGDVVQLHPEVSRVYGGCFALVVEVTRSGVEATIPTPTTSGARNALLQLPRGSYLWVGIAPWLPPGINHDVAGKHRREVVEEEPE